VDGAAAMLVGGRRQAWLREAFDGNAGSRVREPLGHMMPGTTLGPGDRGFASARTNGKLRILHPQITCNSGGASICGRCDRLIRKKVIGRCVSVFREMFTSRSVCLRLLRTLPLLHQPARQHGRGVFLDPKVEKRGNLLAEIGGMVETREFVALQRISRSREKKLPRRLRLVVVHAAPRVILLR